MQNCGKTESDTNLKSCIQVYIQRLKNNKKICFQKVNFRRVMGRSFLIFQWSFRGFLTKAFHRASCGGQTNCRAVIRLRILLDNRLTYLVNLFSEFYSHRKWVIFKVKVPQFFKNSKTKLWPWRPTWHLVEARYLFKNLWNIGF